MKKKLLILLTLMLFAPFAVNAEELKLDWQKDIEFLQVDNYSEIQKSKDNGIIIVSQSGKNIEGLINKGEDDIIIRFYDKDGDMLWQKSWGGNGEEQIESIKQTENDEIIIIGYSTSTDIEGLPNKGGQDAIIVKYDKNGNLLWQNSWGGNGYTSSIKSFLTEDDGIILLSSFDETDIIEGLSNKGDIDAAIVKYDKDGNMVWQKSWGGNDRDYFTDIFQTEDGEFIAYGLTYSKDIDGITVNGSSDIVIVKYNKDGNILWQKTYGGNGTEYLDEYKSIQGKDRFVIEIESTSTDIKETQDSNIIVIFNKEGNVLWQYSSNFNLYFDRNDKFESIEDGFFVDGEKNIDGVNVYILQKYDKNGNELWKKEIKRDVYEGFNIFPTDDGGLLIQYATGSEVSEDIASKIMFEKYDKNGNIQLKKVWDDDKSTTIPGTVLYLSQVDEKTILSGVIIKEEEFGIYGKIVKYDKDGNLLWQQIDRLQIAMKLIQINENEFFALSIGMSNDGNEVVRILKYSTKYNLENITNEKGTSTIEQQGTKGIITPTPNKGYEVDKIIVKDKEGNVLDVEVVKLANGTYSFELYNDVTVEVLFKEIIENPKTGVSSIIGLLFTLTLCFISGLFILKKYNKRYEF